MKSFDVNEKFNVHVYLASINIYIYIYIYIFILNYICMHMLRHNESLKMCKECICIFAYIYMSFHGKVKDLNGFINVF